MVVLRKAHAAGSMETFLFSSLAETRPKKSQAQWTQANEGSHCLLSQTQCILVSRFVFSPIFHWAPCILVMQGRTTKLIYRPNHSRSHVFLDFFLICHNGAYVSITAPGANLL